MWRILCVWLRQLCVVFSNRASAIVKNYKVSIIIVVISISLYYLYMIIILPSCLLLVMWLNVSLEQHPSAVARV